MRSLLMGQPPTTTAEATPSAAEMPAVSVETTGSFWMQSLRSKFASHFYIWGFPKMVVITPKWMVCDGKPY